MFQDFLVYTAETDPLHHPLPSPKEASNALKMETLKLMKIWHEKFSSAYPKLDHAYNFLRSSKAFDFERADAQLQVCLFHSSLYLKWKGLAYVNGKFGELKMWDFQAYWY